MVMEFLYVKKLKKSMRCLLFLSCLSDEETIVRGLNEGGDDYVCKPFWY